MVMTGAAKLDRLAERLWEARDRATPLSSLDPTLTDRDAYAVQMRLLERALREEDRLAGWKVAFTSQAIWEQLGVHEPAFGPLLASRVVEDGAFLQSGRFIRPGVEAEIAFRLAEDLPPPPVTAEVAGRAVARVLPAIEVVDSRCRDWKVTGPEAIADSACAGAVVVGAGDLILTGSLAPIQWVRKEDAVVVSFEHLGSASVRFL